MSRLSRSDSRGKALFQIQLDWSGQDAVPWSIPGLGSISGFARITTRNTHELLTQAINEVRDRGENGLMELRALYEHLQARISRQEVFSGSALMASIASSLVDMVENQDESTLNSGAMTPFIVNRSERTIMVGDE